jgi:hypothetical protein
LAQNLKQTLIDQQKEEEEEENKEDERITVNDFINQGVKDDDVPKK